MRFDSLQHKWSFGIHIFKWNIACEGSLQFSIVLPHIFGAKNAARSEWIHEKEAMPNWFYLLRCAVCDQFVSHQSIGKTRIFRNVYSTKIVKLLWVLDAVFFSWLLIMKNSKILTFSTWKVNCVHLIGCLCLWLWSNSLLVLIHCYFYIQSRWCNWNKYFLFWWIASRFVSSSIDLNVG